MKVVKSNENRIKCLRKLYRLSQTEFAEKYNVAQTAVSNWEKGRNSIDIGTASQIAEDYKVPVEFVYGFDFQVTRPAEEWHDDEKEDMNNADSECADFFLFRYGKGIFPKTHHNNTATSKILAPSFPLTPHETAVMIAYRNHPNEQPIIDKILDVPTDENSTQLYNVAYFGENGSEGIISIPKDEWERLKKLPTTDQDLS